VFRAYWSPATRTARGIPQDVLGRDEGAGYEIVDGSRRYRAMKALKWKGKVPCVFILPASPDVLDVDPPAI
jgi:hypothetical protein